MRLPDKREIGECGVKFEQLLTYWMVKAAVKVSVKSFTFVVYRFFQYTDNSPLF